MEECIICFEETKEFKFYSCSHKLCNKCYNKINVCPLCQSSKMIEIVVIQPISRDRWSMVTTYNIIKCVGIFLLISVVFLYYYKE